VSKERILISSKIKIEKYDENMVLTETLESKEPTSENQEPQTKES
jgi:hypothetical protein